MRRAVEDRLALALSGPPGRLLGLLAEVAAALVAGGRAALRRLRGGTPG